MNMLRLLAAITLFMVCFMSCKDSPNSPIEGQRLLQGRIEDGNSLAGFKLTIRAAKPYYSLILDSANIDSGGTFAIKLPFPAPPDSMLLPFTPDSDSNQYYVTVDERVYSNPSARLAPLLFDVYLPHNIPVSLFNGNQYLFSDSGTAVGDYHVNYFYLNQPTSITGSRRITYVDSLFIKEAGRSRFVTIYDLNLTVGWNKVTTVIRATDSELRIFQVTSESFPDAKWFMSFSMSRNFYNASLL
jgi:hypothetical protein